MSKNQKTSGGFTSLVASTAIVIALVIGIVVYKYVFGNPGNFVDNDPTGEPLEGNFMGIIYKGGIIVPVLVAMNIIVIIFSIERFITLALAAGTKKSTVFIQILLIIITGLVGFLVYRVVVTILKINSDVSPDKFIEQIRNHLDNNDINAAIQLCDKSRSSLANVVRAGLVKYEHIANDSVMDKEQKVEALKKELEEATSLELPMLSKNLGVLSTSASVATLIGLIGTVLGMIRAFAAMSHGTPDTSALATGISEALINTAFGIFASTLAIILYNFFSTKIDSMTYSMDEATFSILQDFSAKNK